MGFIESKTKNWVMTKKIMKSKHKKLFNYKNHSDTLG